MTGMTIPGVDILGSKKGYDANKPWLFEDFDQLTFYPVSEEEYEKQLALFNSGRYEYQWEEVEFDMAEHNKFLKETKAEVSAIRDRQRQAQAKMDQLEKDLLEKWAKEKAEKEIPSDKIETLLQGNFHSCVAHVACQKETRVDFSPDPQIIPIEAPLSANVWKIEIKEGDKLDEDHLVTILEAMKLEINVRAEPACVGGTVDKILVGQGDSVEAGKPLFLIRKK